MNPSHRLHCGAGLLREMEVAEQAIFGIDLLLEQSQWKFKHALVVDDPTGKVSARLSQIAAVSEWHRMTYGDRTGQIWPADGPFDAITLRLSKSREAFLFALKAAISQLSPQGGSLVIYGQNDEGIRSVASNPLLSQIETITARKHGRVLFCPISEPIRSTIDQFQQHLSITLYQQTRDWCSYPGLFAQGGLDEATALLLDALKSAPLKQTALDYGCGTGVIAAALHQLAPQLQISALDPDAVALLATKQNLPCPITLYGYDSLSPLQARFDLIASNPPIHFGKSEDLTILKRLIEQAPAHLNPEGQLWFVVQRQIPVEQLFQPHFDSAHLICETTRFRVWQLCQKP